MSEKQSAKWVADDDLGLDKQDVDVDRSTVGVPKKSILPINSNTNFDKIAEGHVNGYGGLFMNFNIQRRPTPGFVKVELKDIDGMPDGVYYLEEKAVQKIIKIENIKREAEQSEGGIFYSKDEVPPITDDNRDLKTSEGGVIVPKDS